MSKHLERRVLHTDGRAGFLVYGPYAKLPAGRYRVRLIGEWNATDSASPYLEVVTGQGQVTVLRAMLVPQAAAGSCMFEAAFQLAADATDLETRVYVDASTRLCITGIELLGQSNEDGSQLPQSALSP